MEGMSVILAIGIVVLFVLTGIASATPSTTNLSQLSQKVETLEGPIDVLAVGFAINMKEVDSGSGWMFDKFVGIAFLGLKPGFVNVNSGTFTRVYTYIPPGFVVGVITL